ncbi:hypothetical protein LZ30DRAFT_308639 [Colletotrichum cereale]|nr:hypothetical protein LZ30DRAFT_308639 [Colletotrichum cereale]
MAVLQKGGGLPLLWSPLAGVSYREMNATKRRKVAVPAAAPSVEADRLGVTPRREGGSTGAAGMPRGGDAVLPPVSVSFLTPRKWCEPGLKRGWGEGTRTQLEGKCFGTGPGWNDVVANVGFESGMVPHRLLLVFSPLFLLLCDVPGRRKEKTRIVSSVALFALAMATRIPNTGLIMDTRREAACRPVFLFLACVLF